jgi:hypothetical protein
MCNRIVGSSPNRFAGALTIMATGEPSAESFDRFPPRQLDLLIESGRWKDARASRFLPTLYVL